MNSLVEMYKNDLFLAGKVPYAVCKMVGVPY